MQALQGQPGMVEIRDVYVQQHACIIVMELLSGGMLFDHIAQKVRKCMRPCDHALRSGQVHALS